MPASKRSCDTLCAAGVQRVCSGHIALAGSQCLLCLVCLLRETCELALCKVLSQPYRSRFLHCLRPALQAACRACCNSATTGIGA